LGGGWGLDPYEAKRGDNGDMLVGKKGGGRSRPDLREVRCCWVEVGPEKNTTLGRGGKVRNQRWGPWGSEENCRKGLREGGREVRKKGIQGHQR